MSRSAPIVAVLLAVLVACGGDARPGVIGLVSEAGTGWPVVGVRVYVEGTGRGTLTDEEGRYAIQAVPPGRYDIVAEAEGYRTTRHTGVILREAGATQVDFELVPEAVAAVEETFARPARDPMLVRRAEVTLEVEDVDSTAARIREVAADLGGRVERFAHTAGARQTRRTSMSLRIPESRLNAALERVLALGVLERLSVSEREAREQAEDLDVRLRNVRRLEERLLRMLDERAGTLQELLGVERELARVREQVERYESQLQDLESEAAWSLLQIVFHEPYPVVVARPSPPARGRIARAIVRAGDNFMRMIAWGISGLGYLAPLAILAIVVVWSRRWVRRRRGSRSGAGSESRS
ncbi:MAG: hypothetical protein AMS25_18960 [Gemmatimonas sp. SM23_52]|nr:MAG: hypothetical protein AMS25_18960 [Gemmatimonas sp. SM23_52]